MYKTNFNKKPKIQEKQNNIRKLYYNMSKFPTPTELDIKQVTAKDTNEMSRILNRYGVAVLPLDILEEDRNKALDETKYYGTVNSILNKDNQVLEPSLYEKLHPETMKLRKVPDSKTGMIQQYFTPIHWLIQSNKTLRKAMSELYHNDDSNMKYTINRLRVSHKYKFDDYSLHIEGKDLFKITQDESGEIQGVELIDGEIASIVGLTGHRRFVFWDMNGADLKPLYLYWLKNKKGEFTKLPPDFMHKHYGGRRRMINVDCTKQPHLIVWKETAPHEIASSPSSSLFISPISKFEEDKIVKKVCTYQPKEYTGLTYHETNLLGALYNQGGFEWPSGKKLYHFCHQRAYKWWIPKSNSRYITSRENACDTYQMRLINTGSINQHTVEYQEKLKNRGIELPAIAFSESTPNFVVDILKVPDVILRDHGYIKDNGVIFDKTISVEQQITNEFIEAEKNNEVINLIEESSTEEDQESSSEDELDEDCIYNLKDKIEWTEMTLEEYFEYRDNIDTSGELWEQPESTFWIHQTDCWNQTGIFKGFDSLNKEELDHFYQNQACYLMRGRPCYIKGGWDCECRMAEENCWLLRTVEF
tara:strand:- start:236 stop:1999 length:1764 start_codon:yes stop_codon:yes gene_type:complete